MTATLHTVQIGDRLVCRGRIITVTRITPTQVVCGQERFRKNGFGVGVHDKFARLPEPGEVERLLAAQDAEKRRRADERTRREQLEATPRWKLAHLISGWVLLRTTDELCEAVPEEVLQQVHDLLRPHLGEKGTGR